MALMERPAQARQLLEGGRITMPSGTYPSGPHPQDTRTHLREIVRDDPYCLTVEAIDAYADTLAAEHPQRDPLNRGIAQYRMLAFADGWLAGYDEGHEAASAATCEFALAMLDRARHLVPRPDLAALAAFDWLAARLRSELRG